jgi:hypothetical protein
MSAKTLLAAAILISAVGAAFILLREPSVLPPDKVSQPRTPPGEGVEEHASAPSDIQRSEIAEPGEPTPRSTESPALFKPVDEYTSDRFAAAVEGRHFQGPVVGYLRHRIVEIDMDRLLQLLQKSHDAWSRNGSELPVTIDFFPNKSFDVILETWVEDESGTRVLLGRMLHGPPGQTHFQLTITTDGHFFGGLGTPTRTYGLESVGLYPYAVVLEYDNSVEIPFD